MCQFLCQVPRCSSACCQVPVPSVLSLELLDATSFQMMNCCCHCGPLLPSCLLPSCCKSSQDACCQAAECPAYVTEESDEEEFYVMQTDEFLANFLFWILTLILCRNGHFLLQLPLNTFTAPRHRHFFGFWVFCILLQFLNKNPKLKCLYLPGLQYLDAAWPLGRWKPTWSSGNNLLEKLIVSDGRRLREEKVDKHRLWLAVTTKQPNPIRHKSELH
jgi:hypothetical protein